MDLLETDSKWIKRLREQVEHLNDEGADIWSDVDITLCLGDARRLLYALDLVRGFCSPPDTEHAKRRTLIQLTGEEMEMLALGTMEG